MLNKYINLGLARAHTHIPTHARTQKRRTKITPNRFHLDLCVHVSFQFSSFFLSLSRIWFSRKSRWVWFGVMDDKRSHDELWMNISSNLCKATTMEGKKTKKYDSEREKWNEWHRIEKLKMTNRIASVNQEYSLLRLLLHRLWAL